MLESIAEEDTVEYPYAPGSQVWKGHSALLIARPMLIRPIVRSSGIWKKEIKLLKKQQIQKGQEEEYNTQTFFKDVIK